MLFCPFRIHYNMIFMMTVVFVSFSKMTSSDFNKYLFGTIRKCHEKVYPTIYREVDQLFHKHHVKNIGKVEQVKQGNNLLQYIRLYSLCFEGFWSSCLSTREVSANETKHLVDNFPCSRLHIKSYNGEDFYHLIGVKLMFQINITFVEFVLQRSYSGCVYHYLQVGSTVE